MKLGELKTIADIISGYAFKMDSLNNGEDKLIRIGDLQNGKIEIDSAISFNAKKYGVSENFRIKDKDILMALSGATVGKIAVASQCSLDCYLNQRVAIIRAKEGNCANYLKYAFYGKYLEKLLLSAGGAAQPNLSPKNLENMEIPIPPLSTQTQIAQILDKSTALIAKRNAQIAELDKLVQSVFLEMFGDPAINPNNWQISTLDNLSLSKGEYGSGKSAIQYSGGYRYIRITDIMEDGDLKEEYVGVEDEKSESKKYALEKGDIVFARSGATVGKTFLYSEQYGKCIFAGYLIRFKLNQDLVLPEYIKHFTNTNFYWEWVKSRQNVVAQPNINAKQYGAELEIIVPPIPKQKMFVYIANKIHAQKSLLQKSLAELEVQHQALMQKAFNGQLVG